MLTVSLCTKDLHKCNKSTFSLEGLFIRPLAPKYSQLIQLMVILIFICAAFLDKDGFFVRLLSAKLVTY